MSNAIVAIQQELAGKRHLCNKKRTDLLELGTRREKRHRVLTFLSGGLALLGGIAATSVFLELTGSTIVKIVTVILGFASGIMTLSITVFNDPKESAQIIIGAAKYLMLSDKCSEELLASNMTEARGLAALKKIVAEYGELAMRYDRYREGSDASAEIARVERFARELEESEALRLNAAANDAPVDGRN